MDNSMEQMVQIFAVQIILAVWEMLMGYLYLDAVSDGQYIMEKANEKRKMFLCITAGVLMLIFPRYKVLISGVISVAMSFYFILTYWFIKKKMNLFLAEIAFIYNLSLLLLDLAWLFGFAAIAGREILEVDAQLYDVRCVIQFLAYYLARAAVLMVLLYVCNNRKNLEELDTRKNRLVAAAALAVEAVSAYVFLSIYRSQAGMDGLVWACMLLFLTLCGVAFYYYMAEQDIRRKNELMDAGSRTLERSYRELIQMEQEKSIIYHDFKNQIFTLEHYLRGERTKEALEYLEQIKKPFLEYQNRIRSGNELVDMILSSKRREAEDYGIVFEQEIENLSAVKIRDEDMCCILANLLDNAIEANQYEEQETTILQTIDKRKGKETEAAGESREEKWIKVRMYTSDRIFFVEIKNSLREQPVRKAGKLLSRKRAGSIHGVGLESVKRTVNQYNGIMEYDYSDEQFEMFITLFF